jgi:transcriptional regulator with XRE-family HTH domain
MATPTLAERIRAARLTSGLTQAQLGEHIGSNKNAISRYENGHVTPALPTIRRLASVLAVSVDNLIEGVEL